MLLLRIIIQVLQGPATKYVRVVLFVFVVINKNNAYTKTISYYNIAKTDPKEKDQEEQLKIMPLIEPNKQINKTIQVKNKNKTKYYH